MIQEIEIKKLKLLDRNPRTITKEQMAKLVKSIEDDPKFLWNRPVLARESPDFLNDGLLHVYAGNQRVRAAKHLKWKTIPCIVESYSQVSDDQMRRRTILDNKAFGDWDFDILSSDYHLDVLIESGFNLEDLHLDLPDLPEIDESQIKETDTSDDDSETSSEWITCPKCKHEFKE